MPWKLIISYLLWIQALALYGTIVFYDYPFWKGAGISVTVGVLCYFAQSYAERHYQDRREKQVDDLIK